MKIIKLVMLIAFLNFCNVSYALAVDLSGLCLDNGEEGCVDRFIPFYDNSIDFCEETCELTRPTDLRDLDATLYDFVCRGDAGSAQGLSGRVMVLRQTDREGNSVISFIDKRETRPIVPCEQ